MIPLISSLIGLNVVASGASFIFQKNVYKIGVVFSLLSFILSLEMLRAFDVSQEGFQLLEHYSWIPMFNSSIQLGVDGIATSMIILTTFTTLIVLLMTRSLVSVQLPMYTAMFFLLQAAMIGLFSALDGILFYLFWEATLIPMVVCIGIWGSQNRSFAAMKFFLYTFFGSTLFLISIIYLGHKAGSFAWSDWLVTSLSFNEQWYLFLGCLLAFAIKVPMWPVHTWLPDAHTEAPTAGSVLLAALMLKVGAFGLLRFNVLLFPLASQALAWPMVIASLIAIVSVGLIAFAQEDMKKLIAYSSVAHMGFVTLGFFGVYLIYPVSGMNLSLLAFEGAIIQMIAHAFSSGAMFLAFGLLYHQAHTRQMSKFGGLATCMPFFTGFFVLFCFSNIGVPGTAGFVGEFTVIIAMASGHLGVAAIAALSLIIGALYTLWMVRRVFFGPINNPMVKNLKDIQVFDRYVLGVLAMAVLLLGLYPNPVYKLIHPSAKAMVAKTISKES